MIKISGKIIEILDSQTFGVEKTFEKRNFWIEEISDKYPNTFQLELWQQDCDMINSYNVGDFITAYIDLKGKLWEKNGNKGVMNTLKCWNIEKEGKLYKEINNS